MSLLINFLLGIYVLDALLMLLVILMQRPRSEGLGAAFGGGVTENIFGAQTTNVLVKITGWLAAVFFGLTFALSILYAHKTSGDSALRRELLKQQTGGAAAASPAANPAAATGSPAAGAAAGVSPAASATGAPPAPAANKAPVAPSMPSPPAPVKQPSPR